MLEAVGDAYCITYRFGFNGQEKVNEIAGVGNSIYYKAREYDPRIARFKSVDPLTKKYPWYSPYQFAGNTPIQAIDLDGLEEYYTRGGELIGKYGTSTEVRIVYDDMIDRARGVTGASGTSRMGNELNNDLYKNGSAPIFNSTENAAKGWASRFNTKSINEKKEYNSYIFSTKINGKVVGSYTRPEIGMKKETRTKWSPMGLSKYHAHIHSHGDNDVDYNNESFSEEDIDLYKQIGILGYLTTPKGKLKSYNPNNAANKREKVILDKISPDKEMNVQEKEPISQYPLNGDAK